MNAHPIQLVQNAIGLMAKISDAWIALLGRFSVAAIFWKSGQTKVQGFALDIVSGEFHLGWPRLSDSVVDLFRDEYRLPFLPPDIAALLGATAEHVFPALILVGLATRFSALALLGMTATIQLLVYPDAYPTHGVWAVVLLFLVAKGPGGISLDYLIAQRLGWHAERFARSTLCRPACAGVGAQRSGAAAG